MSAVLADQGVVTLSKAKGLAATKLHAKPSRDFDRKLDATIALLQRAATQFAPVTQASSLGAEDVVVKLEIRI